MGEYWALAQRVHDTVKERRLDMEAVPMQRPTKTDVIDMKAALVRDGVEGLTRQKIHELINAYLALREENNQLKADNQALREDSLSREQQIKIIEALGFYAKAESYFAITLLCDPPCGEFADDIGFVNDEWGERPGHLARTILKEIQGDIPPGD